MGDYPALRTRSSMVSSTEEGYEVSDNLECVVEHRQLRKKSKDKESKEKREGKIKSSDQTSTPKKDKAPKIRHSSRENIRRGSVGDIKNSIEKGQLQTRINSFLKPLDIACSPEFKQNKKIFEVAVSQKVLVLQTNTSDNCDTASAINEKAPNPGVLDACVNKIIADAPQEDEANSQVGDENVEEESAYKAERNHDHSADSAVIQGHTSESENMTMDMENNKSTNTKGKTPPSNLSLQDIYAKMVELLESHADAKQGIEQIKVELATANSNYTELTSKVDGVKVIADSNVSRIEKLEAAETFRIDSKDLTLHQVIDHLNQCVLANSARIDNLSSIAVAQNTKMFEMREQIETLMYHSMKANIIIFGIWRKKDENCAQKVTNFFRKVMKIKDNIPVLVAHRLGESLKSPIIAKLANHSQKGVIFKHVSNISKLTNKDGDLFRVTDQLPGLRGEKDRRKRDIICDNNRLDPPARLSLKKEKGMLYREVDKDNWVKYDSLIKCPSAVELLEVHQEARTKLMSIYSKMTPGVHIEKHGSDLYAFAYDVSNIDQINEGYKAVRLNHLQARHVACAFRLPGVLVAQMEDAHDDEEYSVGRILLNALKFANITHKCVYVVRYYSGVHIGNDRFQCYLETARSSINRNPTNSVLQQQQTPWNQDNGIWLAKGKRFPPKAGAQRLYPS